MQSSTKTQQVLEHFEKKNCWRLLTRMQAEVVTINFDTKYLHKQKNELMPQLHDLTICNNICYRHLICKVVKIFEDHVDF